LKERRHRLQIYYEILSAVEMEFVDNGHVRPTKVQHLSNLSYDKLKAYLLKLDGHGLVSIQDGIIQKTQRVLEFLRIMNDLVNLTRNMDHDLTRNINKHVLLLQEQAILYSP